MDVAANGCELSCLAEQDTNSPPAEAGSAPARGYADGM